MNKSQNNKNNIEDQLANFTDKLLDEKNAEMEGYSVSPDPDLQALQQTALRLKNALHEDSPSQAVIQRMHRNIVKQWQQQETKQNKPFWEKWLPSRQKWHSQRSRQNLSVAISLAILVVLTVLAFPLLKGTTLNQPAASGHNLSMGILVASGGLILFAIWFFRRK